MKKIIFIVLFVIIGLLFFIGMNGCQKQEELAPAPTPAPVPTTSISPDTLQQSTNNENTQKSLDNPENYYLPQANNKKAQKTLTQTLENCENGGWREDSEYDRYNLGGYEEHDKLLAIYNLDVCDYFHIGDQCGSDLKRKYFMQSKEYGEKFDELKILKNKIMQTCYYAEGDLPGGSYNIGKQAYESYTRTHFIFNTWFSEYYEGISWTVINPIQKIYVPMSEKDGLVIENKWNLTTTKLYYIFKLNDGKIAHRGQGIGTDEIFSGEFLTATIYRIVIGDVKTNVVYFDRTVK